MSDGRLQAGRAFNPQYSPKASELWVWRPLGGREERSRVVQPLTSGAMAVEGVFGPLDAVRGGSVGSRGVCRTGPPGAAGVSELEIFRWS